MDEILKKYDSFKIEDCINLLSKELQVDDGLVENLIKQNCMNVCQCLDTIVRNDSAKISETGLTLFKSYENIVAVDLPGKSVPILLELTAFFNFIWWEYYYIISQSYGEVNVKVYLPLIQRGLRRGISCKINNYVNLAEDILWDIKSVGKNTQYKDFWTLSLLLEVIVLICLYILKIDQSTHVMEQCLTSLSSVTEDFKTLIKGLEAVKEFKSPCLLHNKLFKFGVLNMNSKVSDLDACSIDYLYIIKSACLFNLKNYKNILMDLKDNLKSTMEPLSCYLGGLSTLMLDDWNQCLGFVLMSEKLKLPTPLRSRFLVLHGLLLSKKEQYKKSLRCFGEAKKICPTNKAAHYYMGEDYGKIGLNEEMIECFITLVRITQGNDIETNKFASNFVSVILDLLHPKDEITESEALYAAAIALGLHERFREAADMFEKYLEICPFETEYISKDDRIIKTPNIVTALHEAAAVNIQIENFARSKHLLEQSLGDYTAKEPTQLNKAKDVHVTKDVTWIRNVLDSELGIGQQSNENQNESLNLFTEEMVNFFEIDVIAFMLSVEIERRMELDTYKEALGKLIVSFTKYIIQMQKKENVSEEENMRLTLVKALAAKTCLNIAKYQIKEKLSKLETERTLKKALTCNPGDVDVLYEYCKFQLAEGNACEAKKLWKTFYAKEPIVSVDHCQSLALRFLLQSQVNSRELDIIKSTMEASVTDFNIDIIN